VSGGRRQTPIDRQRLVSRHNVDWPSLEGQIPLGNGNFAFNADGTGLETVGGNTMSHWCWHSFPLPAGVTEDEIKPWATSDRGRLKGATTPPREPIYHWCRTNPQPLNLGRIGFVNRQGIRLQSSEIHMGARHLNLWTGLLTSCFSHHGESVTVETCVDPKSDTVALRVVSPLLEDAQLQIMLDFPAPALGNGLWTGDFSQVGGHRTEVIRREESRLELGRTVDDAYYQVVLAGSGFVIKTHDDESQSPHQFIFTSKVGNDTVELTCHFGPDAASFLLPSAAEVRTTCAEWWPAFWNRGGAIDLSDSKDPRWMELERRIILSQYQLAVQSAGDYPPAEVGLTGMDPWHAKWHFEMIWWHLAHYALWDRWRMAEKALTIYQRFAPVARAFARNFDYRGLMWPKATGPNGYHTGFPPSMALLWREPHPIFFAELDYRLQPTDATLAKWKDVVFGTADFMADYPNWNETTRQYDLDPVWPASEGRFSPLRRNTIFELGYWRVALELAQQWRLRLALEREPHWDHVASYLTPLPMKDGLYIYSDDRPDTFSVRKFDHLDIIGIAGMLPPFQGLDPAAAHRTVKEVAQDWEWEDCWGWDFPWLAMAAARVGEPGLAIEALLNPAAKNRYDERGLCLGGPPPYLPGNGGLLYAVAMMAAGWDGAPPGHAPGFPSDGAWTVRWENLKAAP
jgi:hypothetical protein